MFIPRLAAPLALGSLLAMSALAQSAPINVAVINNSTVLTDAQVQAALPSFQTQVSRDFAPIWGTDATLSFVPNGGTPPAGYWWVVISDNSDVSGAGGYHDLTTDGLPIGKVFAADAINGGYNWTVTFTHELLEMLGDPWIDESVIVDQGQATDGSGAEAYKAYFHEMGDPVEADQFAYDINGVKVTDFILPAWFGLKNGAGQTVGGTKYDFTGNCTAALQILAGGYMGTLSFQTTNQWGQSTSDATAGLAGPGSGPAAQGPLRLLSHGAKADHICWHERQRERIYNHHAKPRRSEVATLPADVFRGMQQLLGEQAH